MAMKEWFRQMQPVQLYIVLVLSVIFFAVELVASHITHALTLLTDSYHMLCNIIALTGCIFALKYGAQKDDICAELNEKLSLNSSIGEELTSKKPEIAENPCPEEKSTVHSKHATQKEKSLKNTFGWARIDVVVMLVCCVFLCSLCFSIFVEALQTLVHIDHQDEMHNPILVLCIGGFGLVLNGLCYLLIGGYTFHQGSFLYITPSGDVVLDRVVTSESVRKGERRLSRTRHITAPGHVRERENLMEMIRDVIGCVFVIICALIINFTDVSIAKFVDPIISMISAGLLMALSYPYVKESCLILLQTMPGSINIDSLKSKLLEEFPDIVNVHDLHVWQLTATKIISTAHIIFKDPLVYAKYTKDLNEFFIENGITQVTIQPEFFTKNFASTKDLELAKVERCLMNCLSDVCKDQHCCPEIQQKNIFSNVSRSISRELNDDDSTVDLKSIKIVDNESSPSPSTNSRCNSSCNSSCNSIKSIDSIKKIEIEDVVAVNNDKNERNSTEIQNNESVIINKCIDRALEIQAP